MKKNIKRKIAFLIGIFLSIAVLSSCGAGGSTRSKAFQDESSAQEFLLNALAERYGQEFRILDRTHYSTYIIGDVYTAWFCPVSDSEQVAVCRVVDDGTVEDTYAIYFFGKQAEEMAVSALDTFSAVADMTFSYIFLSIRTWMCDLRVRPFFSVTSLPKPSIMTI